MLSVLRKCHLQFCTLSQTIVDKKIEQQQILATTEQVIPTVFEGNIIYETKFGALKLVKNSFLTDLQKKQVRSVHYLINGVGANYVRKIFKEGANSLFIFDCEKMNHLNASEIYQASKRMLDKQYFGTHTEPKDPFMNCKTPQEHFNLHRRILIDQKKLLSRLNLVVGYNGVVRIQGNVPECNTLQYFLEEQFFQLPGYKRYNYLLPFSVFQGIITAYNYEKEGIPIKQLGGAKIFPLYGVWQPTQDQYLELLTNQLTKIFLQYDFTSLKKFNIIDLGCGTGVLGFIANFLLKGRDHNLFSIDNNENAVKSAKINSQVLKLENFKALQTDLNKKDQYTQEMADARFPKKYNLILANPPWMVASKLSSSEPLEGAVYDPKSEFLNSILSFTSNHLESKGRLILIYSDLSEILNLVEKEQIEVLCKKYQLIISSKMEVPFKNKETTYIDPLQKFKSQASVQVFEIKKL